VILGDGLRSGALLSLCSIALAMLGLTPALSWIPELPLLGTAILLPVGILAWTGWRAASRAGRLTAGPLTGALAGAIGGVVAGIAFVITGKPALNIAVGLVGGTLSGSAIGFAGALMGRYRTGGFRT
jgi:hypothetical protein